MPLLIAFRRYFRFSYQSFTIPMDYIYVVNKTVIEELKELTKSYNMYNFYLDFNKSYSSCRHNPKLGNTYKILCPKRSKAYNIIDTLKF